jgi:hypothetical protein
MEPWQYAEIRARRDSAYSFAAKARQLRLIESGRITGVRARIADGTEAVGHLLVGLARAIRRATPAG